jgi:O-antigen/teichoic acid export membrane protein
MLQVVIMYQATNFLISNIGGPTDVTSYNIAYKYLGVSTMIINIILTPIWPAFTDSFTKKAYPWMRRIYKKMTTIEFIVIAGIVLMVAISPFVYHIWIGHKAIIPLAMSIIVGVYMMVDCWLSLHMNILNGMGTIQLQLYVTLIGLVAHIPLSFFIGHFIGPLGVGLFARQSLPLFIAFSSLIKFIKY